MIPNDRPDLLQASLKKILNVYGAETSEGATFNNEDNAAWSRFCNDYNVKKGDAGQPEYGMLHPILRLWVDSIAAEIEKSPKEHGLRPVVESKNHPSPTNYLPNVGDGIPSVTSDAAGNPVFGKVDSDGNPAGISAKEQAQMRQVLNAAVPSSADAETTRTSTDAEPAVEKSADGEPKDGEKENGDKKDGAPATDPAAPAADTEKPSTDGQASGLNPNSPPGGVRRPDQQQNQLGNRPNNPAQTIRTRTN